MKKFLVSTAALFASLSLVACSSGQSAEQSPLDKIKEKGTLVVATSPDYAPFEFQTLVDGENKVVGSDIMLAQKIADELGVELEISSMNFDNVPAVETGFANLARSPKPWLKFLTSKILIFSSQKRLEIIPVSVYSS